MRRPADIERRARRAGAMLPVLLAMVLLASLPGNAQTTRPHAGAAADSRGGGRAGFDDQLIHPAAPEASNATGSSNTPPSSFDFPRIALALAAVIGLILLLKWASHRLFSLPGAAGAGGAIQVLTRSTVSARSNLLLVRVGRRLLVVAETGTQMNPLSEITDPDEVAALIGQLGRSKASGSRAFGSLFSRASDDFGSEAEKSSAEANEESPAAQTPAENATVAAAQEELDGLAQRVRLLARQYRGS